MSHAFPLTTAALTGSAAGWTISATEATGNLTWAILAAYAIVGTAVITQRALTEAIWR